jgi:RNA polymerase sigma-70 factor, ECF subfamily
MNENPTTQTNARSPAGPSGAVVSDEQLMLSVANESSEAFAELFRRYKQPLYGFFRRRILDPAHAEELTQETFLALLRAAPRYQPRALFRTYLYAIGLKILRAHRRKTAFRATFFSQRSIIPDPVKHDATEAELWVRGAVEKLDPIEREILLLREFEQLSYAEIAELLDLPLNTVRSRLFRARTALRDLLDPSHSSSTESATRTSEAASLGTKQPAPQSIVQKGDRA